MIKELILIILLILLFYSNYDLLKKHYYIYLYKADKLSELESNPKYTTNINNITKFKNEFDKIIFDDINQTFGKSKIKDMLLYAVNEGKRIRPTIILSTYEKNNNSQIPKYVTNACLCIEYIHCASLILDDIMDQDYVRRGRLAMHVKYGLANSQLCAGILCIYGAKLFNNCLDELNRTYSDFNKNIPIILSTLISELLTDLCMGQYLDISINPSNTQLENINPEDLIHKKTSTLFEYCLVMSWILTNYNKSDELIEQNIKSMRESAKQIGLMFQIADDFEDYHKDLKRNGKNMLMNYVIVNGNYEAKNKFDSLLKEFKEKNSNLMNDHIAELLNLLEEKVNKGIH